MLGARGDRLQQAIAGLGNLTYGAIEGLLIGLRRFAVAGDLPHKLQRCAIYLFGSDRMVGISKDFDASAHACLRFAQPVGVCDNMSRVPPRTEGLLESSLYVGDVAASIGFYERIFGFTVISRFGDRGCALAAGDRQVLLLFRKGASRDIQSPHDGAGELHVAFAIGAAELQGWEEWLAKNGIPVEERRTWERGGQSVYFRDPDRHLLELATPGVWSIY